MNNKSIKITKKNLKEANLILSQLQNDPGKETLENLLQYKIKDYLSDNNKES